MGRAIRSVAFCVGVLALGVISRADAIYDSWAKCKVGTSVTFSTQTEAMGTKSQGTMTDTLKEVTPDAAKIEMKMSMTVGGRAMDLPPQVVTVKSSGSKSPATAPVAGQISEEVVINGKTYSCRVTSGTTENSGMKFVFKTWTCDDVPGQVVKTDSSTTGTMTSKTDMTLTKVDQK